MRRKKRSQAIRVLQRCDRHRITHAQASLKSESPVIAYLFTTFPKYTETFLQREIIAMQAYGLKMRIYSLWGGGGHFRGMPVATFPKWKLLTLIWMIPYTAIRWPKLFGELLKGLFTRKAPSWMNFWENMLGAGLACLYAGQFRDDHPTHIHGAWGGAPATAAWILGRMDGHRFSSGAHAYDIYEHGGDWWLQDKLVDALFIHTSTEMGRASLIEHNLDAKRIFCIRRGLDAFPDMKTLRSPRKPLQIICIARLVEKKGLRHQLRIYAALKKTGLEFAVKIVGEGPLRQELEQLREELRLDSEITFTGHLSNEKVWAELGWADVLVHSGVIAASGYRDGLPNVIPEAMSIGTLVVTSPIAATTEAIENEVTGLVALVESEQAWLDALQRLAEDDGLAETLRTNARAWTEENFDAHKNANQLREHFERVIQS